MSPYLLERLHARLGRPRFFWPLVGIVLLVLWMVGSAIAPGEML